jgi:hypothetical protein
MELALDPSQRPSVAAGLCIYRGEQRVAGSAISPVAPWLSAKPVVGI